ncbi:hypothetical protein NDR89_23070 [Cupriavidus gilardii]|uniref:Uncharacterized protein n=1 Tax=Cupriavidus gilardii TaxID=82541 RepID=A0ABY4VR50_9BURK|nr:hypothetical protein [Cupriavidus gilardii]USE79475.1 hypothetical protein NDR89_23070 [Cupriavidus gilardii]
MPVPNTIADLSQSAGSNYPLGTDTVGPDLDNYLRAGFSFTRQVFDGSSNLLGSIGGTANAITATCPVPFTAYVNGQTFRFVAASTNSGAATININGIGAKAITKAGNAPLVAGDMPAGAVIEVVYDGTQFQMVSLSRNGRTLLVANRSYYVATTGNDNNDGLSPGTAFATLQKAWDTIKNTLDLGGFAVTVNVATGTYAPLLPSGFVIGATGPGSVTFAGSSATISTSTLSAAIGASAGAQLTVTGFTVSNSLTDASGITSTGYGTLVAVGSGMAFEFCSGSHMLAHSGGIINVVASYAITSGASAHLNTANNGAIALQGGITVAISGTQGFPTAFALATGLSQINAGGVTFTGTGSGTRYNVGSNSMINSSGGGPNYFPGHIDGVSGSGGIYL